MKKLSILKLVMLLGLFINYYIHNFNDFKQISLIMQICIAILMLLSLILLVLNGFTFKYESHYFTRIIQFNELFDLIIIRIFYRQTKLFKIKKLNFLNIKLNKGYISNEKV